MTTLAREHLDDAVRVHLQAFPTFFLSSLGPAFLKEFYAAFLVDAGSVALVAEDGSRLCGVVVGSIQPAGFFKRLLIRRWWAFVFTSMKAVLQNPGIVPRLFRGLWYRGDSPPGTERALLSSIAVDPDKQGLGIGKELARRWVAEARQRGCRGCYLTTDTDNNEAANGFYRGLGWTLESTYITRQSRRMNRYVYDFDPSQTRVSTSEASLQS